MEESRYLRPVFHVASDHGLSAHQAVISSDVDSEDLRKLINMNDPDVTFRHQQTPTDLEIETHIALQGFKGVVLEMALALKVDPGNNAFYELFSLLLPIFYAAAMPQMSSSVSELCSGSFSVQMNDRNSSLKNVDIVTFKEHFKIVADEISADMMPQHISIADESCPSSTFFFSYVIRSTCIMFMLDHFLRTVRESVRRTMLAIFSSVTGSLGVGFCFEYFSLRGIGQETQPISVYGLPRAANAAATQMTVSRTQLRYFYHESQVITFDPNTLYLPVHSNYAGVDAIGSATIGGHGYLVFYQATIKPKHPVFKNQEARDNWETSRAYQVVTYWRNLAQAAEITDAIIVFITCNDQFTEVQNDYVNLQLPTQYVYMKDEFEHLG
jgi:hypothetical protein